MRKSQNPREMAEAILERSRCKIKVGAVIADKEGIFAWGWNHDGPDGLGLCAERHALKRANRKRFDGATIYVAARRVGGDGRGKSKVVPARPCDKCFGALWPTGLKVEWRDKDAKWRTL